MNQIIKARFLFKFFIQALEIHDPIQWTLFGFKVAINSLAQQTIHKNVFLLLLCLILKKIIINAGFSVCSKPFETLEKVFDRELNDLMQWFVKQENLKLTIKKKSKWRFNNVKGTFIRIFIYKSVGSISNTTDPI